MYRECTQEDIDLYMLQAESIAEKIDNESTNLITSILATTAVSQHPLIYDEINTLVNEHFKIPCEKHLKTSKFKFQGNFSFQNEDDPLTLVKSKKPRFQIFPNSKKCP